MKSAADRNISAEVRAVEEGHRAFVQPRGWVKVISDTHEGKSYRVDFMAFYAGEPIYFMCQPAGANAYKDDHMVRSAESGVAGCKHAALAARRLEREGFAEFGDDGLWHATERGAHDFKPPPALPRSVLDDPFLGLPS